MGSMETVNPTIPTDIIAMVLDMVVLIPLVIRPLTAPLMVKPRLHITIIITAIIIMAPDMVWATKHLTMVLELVMVLATKHLTMVMVTNMVLVVTKHLTMVATGPHMVLVTKRLTMAMVMEPCLMVIELVMVGNYALGYQAPYSGYYGNYYRGYQPNNLSYARGYQAVNQPYYQAGYQLPYNRGYTNYGVGYQGYPLYNYGAQILPRATYYQNYQLPAYQLSAYRPATFYQPYASRLVL